MSMSQLCMQFEHTGHKQNPSPEPCCITLQLDYRGQSDHKKVRRFKYINTVHMACCRNTDLVAFAQKKKRSIIWYTFWIIVKSPCCFFLSLPYIYIENLFLLLSKEPKNVIENNQVWFWFHKNKFNLKSGRGTFEHPIYKQNLHRLYLVTMYLMCNEPYHFSITWNP